jgi:hypothetical protein
MGVRRVNGGAADAWRAVLPPLRSVKTHPGLRLLRMACTGAGMDEAISIHTHKNGVDIRGSEVEKRFHRVRKGLRRFDLEVKALQRLAGMEGIPVLLEHSREDQRIVMSRLPGMDLKQSPQPPDSCFLSLRGVVAEMLERGVARHAIPPRDVIVQPDGTAGLVDFERITLRWCRWGPVWWMACRITRFHLLRLTAKFAPHLLTPAEQRRFAWQWRIRNFFRRFVVLKGRLRSGPKRTQTPPDSPPA